MISFGKREIKVLHAIDALAKLIMFNKYGVGIKLDSFSGDSGFVIRIVGLNMGSRDVIPAITINNDNFEIIGDILYFDGKKKITYNLRFGKPIIGAPQNLRDLIENYISKYYRDILRLEPWLDPSSWTDNRIELGRYPDEILEIARRLLVLALIKNVFVPKADPNTLRFKDYYFDETLIECLKILNNFKQLYLDIISLLSHLISGKNMILIGPPGSGKTRLAKKIAEFVCGEGNYYLVTANAEWTHFDVIGGITHRGWEDGFLVIAVKKCRESLKNADTPFWLIIDEINRANLDLAFGQAFTLLDIEHRNIPLNVGSGKLYMPFAFRIVATMNPFDKSILFQLGYALRRRFALVDVPSPFESVEQHAHNRGVSDIIKTFDLNDVSLDESIVRECINEVKKFYKQKYMSIFYKRIKDELKNHDSCFGFGKNSFYGLLDTNLLRTRLENFNEKEIEGAIKAIYGIARRISKQPSSGEEEGEEEEEEKREDIGLGIKLGYGQIVDAIKFIWAYYILNEPISSNFEYERDIVLHRAVDLALRAYILPQLEYMSSRIVKEILTEGESQLLGNLQTLRNKFNDAGLTYSRKYIDEFLESLITLGGSTAR